MYPSDLSEQEIGRRQSLQALRDAGINPYPAEAYPTNALSTDILATFKDDEEPKRAVCDGQFYVWCLRNLLADHQ